MMLSTVIAIGVHRPFARMFSESHQPWVNIPRSSSPQQRIAR